MVRPKRWAAAALTAAVAAPLITTGPVAATPSPDRGDPLATAGDTASITLVTGDTVTLGTGPADRHAVAVEPAEDRESVAFHTRETDDGLLVFPEDAMPYVAAGVLDERLFDVTLLAREGYDDESRATLPLLVRDSGADGSAAAQVAGATVAGAAAVTATAALPSADAVAAEVDRAGLDTFWRALTGDAEPGALGAGDTVRAFGDEDLEIWLDGPVEAALDRSVSQVGAPTAWDAGVDGSGTTVAVLDTGVDAEHPDLAGVVTAEENFTTSDTAGDLVGHGTHVAATVAGSGKASDGDRRGVAPGAEVVSGKVLGDTGFGRESWIISGMEWAATEADADVVNMSLGGATSDGTDPLSTAVDQLTAETGTLFVASAGNDGTDYSIEAPGAATAALTVGAVDREDALADFSSRGPRAGDNGLKPEITAPGVEIVAARADGTDMGTPVDDHYTAASGTSMAAPHVAGAAALLAGHRPDADPAQLKDALVSTAERQPDENVFAQGTGRLAADRAVTGAVYGTGVFDAGMQEQGQGPDQVDHALTYTNRGDAPRTLTLEAALTNIDQGTSAAAALSFDGLDDGTVTVPAGETVEVPVTLDLTALERGRHSGWITASSDDGASLHTAVAGTLAGPTHEVTLRAVDPAGEPTSSPAVALHGTEPRTDVLEWLSAGEEVTVEVEEGTYLLHALVPDRRDAQFEESHVITEPELEITGDREVVLDARTTTPVEIRTPEPAEQRDILNYHVYREMANGRTLSWGSMHFSTVRQVNVTPNDPVAEGRYEFSSRWQLVAPAVDARVPGMDGELDMQVAAGTPRIHDTHQWPLVYVGSSLEDVPDHEISGAVVLASGEFRSPSPELLQQAADAGAEAVLTIIPESMPYWVRWRPNQRELPLPAMKVEYDSGQRLIAHAEQPGTARIHLTTQISSPYLYDVMHVEDGHVPEQVVYEVDRENSARQTTRYTDTGGFDWANEQRFGWRPWQSYAPFDTQRLVEVGTEREEWITAGDTLWQHRVHHRETWDNMNPLRGGMVDAPSSYPAEHLGTVGWHQPVTRPAAPVDVDEQIASVRDGDQLHLRVPEFVDATNHHYGIARPANVDARLLRDGELLTELPNARAADVPTVAEPASYQLELETQREEEDWRWGTATETVWRFDSQRPAGDEPQPLRLLQVDYEVPADVDGTVRGNGRHMVGLRLRHQDGLPEPQLADIAMEVSFDEGDTWHDAPVRGPAHNLRAHLPRPDGDTVSLRVHAEATDGSAVTQTVLRAYGLR